MLGLSDLLLVQHRVGEGLREGGHRRRFSLSRCHHRALFGDPVGGWRGEEGGRGGFWSDRRADRERERSFMSGAGIGAGLGERNRICACKRGTSSRGLDYII